MSAESPRHARSGGPLTVPPQPPSDRTIIDAVSGFINDVKLTSSLPDTKDTIQWARFETADINEPTPEGDNNEISPLLLILGYGSGVQVWLIPPSGEAQEVLSWRQGTVRVLRVLPTPQIGDSFASKRPLIALCDSASPGPTFCSLSFISIRGGEQVKSIKFKNPILDVLANKRSVVVSFSERFAVFDAGTLEDRMAVTTCYPCPCPLGGSAPINPLALGDRWLAYADKKINPTKKSSGGCEGEGVASYTATVLHAAKSLGKGLRGLGESVAQSLGGTRGASPPRLDQNQPGVLTVIDIEGNNEDDSQDGGDPYDSIVAHFIAHSDAIIALAFDSSGMLLISADRRGHDFHVFRINPHPCGSARAAVHHLYTLHRGDTTAKVQDITISADSRWAAISTLRGTTHIFPISPYGGVCGVRTHTQPRVVNRLSRFHRSAGLPIAAHPTPRAGSPVGDGMSGGAWFPNPRLPPHPPPATVPPLAQIRPTAALPTHTITRTSSGRQRLSSLSEDTNPAPLLARARFGPPPACQAAAGGQGGRAAQLSLYLLPASGCLLHAALHPRPARSVPKEKICDESPIELDVEPVAQWPLQRPAAAADLLAPLPPSNPLLATASCRRFSSACVSEEERWLSQVEIVTHAGPHRRLWMGPQFVFKTYSCTGSNSSLSEAETVEVETIAPHPARSNPVNMPGARPLVPVLIDSGSASSLEHSPSDSFRRKSLLAETGRAASVCDVQLREDLAEAMKEEQGCALAATATATAARAGVSRAVDPLGWVVEPAAAPAPPPPEDTDLYTHSNEDEARFRPVVAGRAPDAPPTPPARPLPLHTRIPAQASPAAPAHSPGDPAPLQHHVVIPAALTTHAHNTHDTHTHDTHHIVSLNKDLVVEAPRDDSLPRPVDIQPTARVKVSPTKVVSDDSVSVDRESPEQVRQAEVITVQPHKSAEPFPEIRSAKSKRDTKNVDVKEEKPKRTKESKEAKRENDDNKDVSSKDKVVETPVAEIKDVKGEECSETELKTSKDKNTTEIKVTKDVAGRKDKEKSYDKNKSSVEKEVVSTETKVTKISKKERDERKYQDDKKVKVEKKEKNDSYKHTRASQDRDNKAIETKPIEVEIKATQDKYDEHVDKVMKTSKDKTITEEPRTSKSCVDKVELVKEPAVVSEKKKRSDRKEAKKKEVDVEEFEKVHVDKVMKTSKDKTITEEPRTSKTCVDKVEIVKESAAVSEKKERNDRKEAKKKDVDVEEFEKAVDEPSVAVTLKLRAKVEPPKKRSDEVEIKTEEQAWDMLLNETEKAVVPIVAQPPVQDKVDEPKSKSKKNRRHKKSVDETAAKDEDSFVEIHNIEQQANTGDLVSISTSYDDAKYARQTYKPKARSAKSSTPDRTLDWGCDEPFEFAKPIIALAPPAPIITPEVDDSDISVETSPSQQTEFFEAFNTLQVRMEGVASETTSFIANEAPRTKKSKSLSPFLDSHRKLPDKVAAPKDLIIIDSSKEDFPDIKITSATRNRKKSPQITEPKVEKLEPPPVPAARCWSSIASSKSKKADEKVEVAPIEVEPPKLELAQIAPAKPKADVSLQEKLAELCKRTDIMVAECDAPASLTFVEEHHSLHDLPPLEPLDFALDDFRLDVMRDSLLDNSEAKITSPICKINIDDILSSIKDTTSRVLETSTFNLVDMQKVPKKKERGFSVIENEKITTQEIDINICEAASEKEMEKSSEDDSTPVASTDSDDKKSVEAAAAQPAKHTAKAKKTRRKKK